MKNKSLFFQNIFCNVSFSFVCFLSPSLSALGFFFPSPCYLCFWAENCVASFPLWKTHFSSRLQFTEVHCVRKRRKPVCCGRWSRTTAPGWRWRRRRSCCARQTWTATASSTTQNSWPWWAGTSTTNPVTYTKCSKCSQPNAMIIIHA